MPEIVPFLILFGVGLLAGTINVMAGGGSTLTLPTLIFLGLDAATANGTNRVAIVLQNVFATLSFRQEKVSRFRQSLTLALLKMNLVFVNMHKVVVILLYTGPTLLVFALTDNVDWTLGLNLAAGNALGAWWGAKLAVRRGEKLIRYVLIVAVLIMAAKILGVF